MFYWALVQPGLSSRFVVVAPSRNGLQREVSMRTCKVVRTLAQAAFFGTLAIGSAIAQSPQTGTITGRVTDAANGQPVSAAQISIVGTNAGTQANVEGNFTLRGVNPGTF